MRTGTFENDFFPFFRQFPILTQSKGQKALRTIVTFGGPHPQSFRVLQAAGLFLVIIPFYDTSDWETLLNKVVGDLYCSVISARPAL